MIASGFLPAGTSDIVLRVFKSKIVIVEDCPSLTNPSDITQTYAYRRNYGFGQRRNKRLVRMRVCFPASAGISAAMKPGCSLTSITRRHWASASRAKRGAAPTTLSAWLESSAVFRMPDQRYLQAGGTGILDGDGALSYGWEKVLETYYDFPLWKSIHLAADYQFVADPIFNRDRGPVNILATRLHMEF